MAMKWFFFLLFSLMLISCGPFEPYYRGVYIYSVTATPTSQEQITLKNDAVSDADISNWKLGDLNDPWAYNIPSGTIIPADDTQQFPGSTLGFQINDEDEELYLRDNAGKIIDTWSN
jgi:hypothetical protein